MRPRLSGWAGCVLAVVVYFQMKAHDSRAFGKGTNLLCTATFGNIFVLHTPLVSSVQEL
jgi:hypothetical protein